MNYKKYYCAKKKKLEANDFKLLIASFMKKKKLLDKLINK